MEEGLLQFFLYLKGKIHKIGSKIRLALLSVKRFSRAGISRKDVIGGNGQAITVGFSLETAVGRKKERYWPMVK